MSLEDSRSDVIDQLWDRLKGLRLAIFQALLLQPPEPLLEVSFKSRSVKLQQICSSSQVSSVMISKKSEPEADAQPSADACRHSGHRLVAFGTSVFSIHRSFSQSCLESFCSGARGSTRLTAAFSGAILDFPTTMADLRSAQAT